MNTIHNPRCAFKTTDANNESIQLANYLILNTLR